MTTLPATSPPASLMLATDLSPRCDRALDRAAGLAQEWKAELIVAHVLDPAAHPDQALAWAADTGGDGDALHIARRQIDRDLAGLPVRAEVRIMKSRDISETIRNMATVSGVGLVVAGVARYELLGRFLLGSSVERLARTLAQPLLIVRNRPHAPYRRIVVATDFSEASRNALLTAAQLFPGCELTAFHAYLPPFAVLTDTQPQPASAQAQERAQYDAFIAATALPAGTRVTPLIVRGGLELHLTQHVRQHDVDLVVMGAQGRDALTGALLGSTAAKLLDCLPCDSMVVPRPRSAG